MPVSDRKKKTNADWNSKNMKTVACTMRLDQAERFRAYCAANGTTPHAALKDYILSCIE